MFAQGFKEDQMWIEARKLFLNEHRKYDGQSNMTLSTFYGTSTSSGYYFWLDLRSTNDNNLHGKWNEDRIGI